MCWKSDEVKTDKTSETQTNFQRIQNKSQINLKETENIKNTAFEMKKSLLRQPSFFAFMNESKFFYRSLLPLSQMSAHLVTDKQLSLNGSAPFWQGSLWENQGQCVCHFFCRLRLDMNQFQCKKIVYFANCNCRDELKIIFFSLRRRILRC